MTIPEDEDAVVVWRRVGSRDHQLNVPEEQKQGQQQPRSTQTPACSAWRYQEAHISQCAVRGPTWFCAGRYRTMKRPEETLKKIENLKNIFNPRFRIRQPDQRQASSQPHHGYDPRVERNERFSEGLTLKPLVDGKVFASFLFGTELRRARLRDPAKVKESLHTLPTLLGQILRTYSVSELHLTLNAGKWDYDHWGLPTDGDVATGGTFWAWIGEGGDVRTYGRDTDNVTFTSHSLFLQLFSLPQPFAPHSFILPTKWTHHLRHATLPSENVCTENLTPFFKLLPCKGKSGLASLLYPHKLFDANWHGLGVHVTWDPPSSYSKIPELNDDEETDKGVVRVRLSFQAVLDPLRKPSVQRQGLAYFQELTMFSNRTDWSFESLFGRQVERSCPVAEDSRVTVSTPGAKLSEAQTRLMLANKLGWDATIPQVESKLYDDMAREEEQDLDEMIHEVVEDLYLDEIIQELDDSIQDVEKLEENKDVENVVVEADDYTLSPDPFLFREVAESGGGPGGLEAEYLVHRAIRPTRRRNPRPSGACISQTNVTEKSQLSGRLNVEIVNHHRQSTYQSSKNDDGSIDIIYLETMPWIVQFYLHTLVPKINGVVRPDAISNITYTPSIPHGRPTTYQATFHIPANATLTFTMDITKAFLRYTEHPPDAQRGWDLPPAVVFVPLESWCPTYRRLYTPPLLITLATPDFSMPYNVIIFTCTVVAFVFASVFNLLTRQFVIVDMREKGGEE
ncbi:Gpi16 subunit, GPI transamidase component-domain-containing protein [Coprinopsis sp. MPI-PUGE-AT-0042]|nr:Gpi16 subunit, GPI transamidase component-domain-containing protein [Coprinopsis sp. MPI-PUGE-AT-0042]